MLINTRSAGWLPFTLMILDCLLLCRCCRDCKSIRAKLLFPLALNEFQSSPAGIPRMHPIYILIYSVDPC